MKLKLHGLAVYLFLLSTAILATIYLAWLAYPLEIKWLHLENVVYMKAADISYNFNILLNYLTNPFQQVLSMPNFSSSVDGLYHFQQVKWLFHLAQVVFLVTLPSFVLFIKNILKKGFGSLFRRSFIVLALLPVIIGGIAVLIGFNAFFTLFHQILFAGDSTWLFNPNTDPVIYILPEEFFLHCFILFFILYESSYLLMLAYIHKKRPKSADMI